MSRIMIIDDDKALCRSMQIQLEMKENTVLCSHTAEEGAGLINSFKPEIIFLDMMLPGKGGLEFLGQITTEHPDIPVVMITGNQDMKSTITAIQGGAFDYVRKPFTLEDLEIVIEKAKRQTGKSPTHVQPVALPFPGTERNEIIGRDEKILEVIKKIGKLSSARVNVMIDGESGTGKELVARALHEYSTPDKPFVAINCTAVVPTLLESELFGHEKGSFTGAASRKVGKLEYAEDGTVFFDEIGDMPFELQSKLLRVLQEREFERVGGLKSIPFRARVVTATHQNLELMIEQGRFRQDLYYRLLVSKITIPPLRERRGDIPLIVNYLIEKISKRIGREINAIEKEALRKIQNYDWPGNVRELDNVLTKAMIMARGNILTEEDIDFYQDEKKSPENEFSIRPLCQIEKEHIEKALIHTGWNITRCSTELEISPTTLRKKISDYKLKKPGKTI
jgi:two-component system, NtrC family, response regulator AtoC